MKSLLPLTNPESLPCIHVVQHQAQATGGLDVQMDNLPLYLLFSSQLKDMVNVPLLAVWYPRETEWANQTCNPDKMELFLNKCARTNVSGLGVLPFLERLHYSKTSHSWLGDCLC